MEEKLKQFLNPSGFSVLVHSSFSFKDCQSNAHVGYIHDEFAQDFVVYDYLLEQTQAKPEKIEKAFVLVQLDFQKKSLHVSSLTRTEKMKVKLIEALLLHSQILVFQKFFQDLIYAEREYFKRFFRDLMNKQHLLILLLEDDLNFICETVKKFYLNTKNGYRLIENFYDDEIYEYVSMPYSIEFVKYFESCGHKVDHELTFNETLKAIYRSVK